MRVVSKNFDPSGLTEVEVSFYSRSQTFLTVGAEYEVHAVSVYKGVVFVLIFDDLSTPTFYPSYLFFSSDFEIPSGWIINFLGVEGVSMVAGYDFMAKSLDSYNDIVDQRLDSVRMLVERIRRGASCSDN